MVKVSKSAPGGPGNDFLRRRALGWSALAALALAVGVGLSATKGAASPDRSGQEADVTASTDRQESEDAELMGPYVVSGADALGSLDVSDGARASLGGAVGAWGHTQGIAEGTRGQVTACSSDGSTTSCSVTLGDEAVQFYWDGSRWSQDASAVERSWVDLADGTALASAFGEADGAKVSAAWGALAQAGAGSGRVDYLSSKRADDGSVEADAEVDGVAAKVTIGSESASIAFV